MTIVIENPSKKILKMIEDTEGTMQIKQFEKEKEEALLSYMEDIEDSKIAEEAYKNYLNSGEKRISADEVFKKLGI